MENSSSYELIDSGEGRKLERFGKFILSRPQQQAVWRKTLPKSVWDNADAIFTREGENQWIKKKHLPTSWNITIEGITLKIQPTDFGHLGVFPEQEVSWKWLKNYISSKKRKEPIRVLNLFAYSGGATLACLQAGAEVCHLDASKGMVSWARENYDLNHNQNTKVRWIIDDVMKFLVREKKRMSFYNGIILDPPTFGRGPKGELFKVEETILPLLDACRDLCKTDPLFILLSSHTPGFTPQVLTNLLHQTMRPLSGIIESGEMVLTDHKKLQYPLPSGTYARWIFE